MSWRAQDAYDRENVLLLKDIDWRNRFAWDQVFIACSGLASAAIMVWTKLVS